MPFDPTTFMSQNFDTPMATKLEICPAGDFRFIVDDFDVEKVFRTIDGKNGPFTVWEIPCVLQDEAVKAKLGRDKVIVRYKGYLDFNDDGTLAFGPNKNVKIGQLREALGQNAGSWNFGMLRGAGPFMGRVVHVPNDKDKDNPYVEISRVVKIS